MKKILSLLLLSCLLVPATPSFAQLGECYHTLDELHEFIFMLQDSFPDRVKVDSIGHSRGEMLDHVYPIYAVKFSNNVEVFRDKPVALIIAHIHAEEVAGLEATVRFMEKLARRQFQPYPTLMEETQIYVIPTMNPDGLQVISNGTDLTWRKNGYRPPPMLDRECNYSPDLGGDSCGVDLNRNFDLNWVWGDSLWYPTANEAFDYFRGPGPFSEPEAQAVRDFARQIKPTVSLVWHSSRAGGNAEFCITPWQWHNDEQGETPAKHTPDHASLERFVGNGSNGLSGSTTLWPSEQGHYRPTYGKTHNGSTQDWFYRELGTFQILVETSPPIEIQPPCSSANGQTLGSLTGTLIPVNEWLCRRLINLSSTDDMNNQGAPLAIYTQDSETQMPISAEWRLVNTWSALLAPWYTNEEHGRATFLPAPGLVQVMARKEGYRPDTASVSISPGGFQTSVTLDLEPLPWHTLTLRVEDESGAAVPSRIHLISEFPQWLDLPAGEMTLSKPVAAYAVEVIPDEDEDQIALFRHFWFHTDSSFTFVIPEGGNAMTENFDTNGMNDWTTGGTGDSWGLITDTTVMVYGSCLHTNPTTAVYRPTYANNANTWIEYNDSIDLDDDNAAHLRFDRAGRLEVPFDSFFVEVSLDGNDWEVAKGYCDMQIPWTRDWVSLSRWAGQEIHLRFRLQSDGSRRELGFHIDNLSIVSGIDLDGREAPAVIPYSYKITRAYPNPFNPSTTIDYEVAAPGQVTFAIFNLLGQEVYRLNEMHPVAGAYSIRWDGVSTAGRALSSGIYFLRLQTDVVHSTKKLMLLK